MFFTRGHARPVRGAADEAAARAMGVVSIGIGLTEILAPKLIEKAMGVGNGENTGVLRVLGVREIAHGVDLLAHKDPTPGLWARVAGDVLDGALLAAAARKARRPIGFAAVLTAVAPVVVADLVLAPRLTRDHGRSG